MDKSALNGPGRGTRQSVSLTLAAVSFAVLATVVFAGTRPFALSDVPQFATDSQATVFEFLIYFVSTSVCIGACAVNFRPRRLDVTVLGLLCLIAYCGTTLLWSEALFRGTVRYGQFVLVSLAALCICYTIDHKRIIAIVYFSLVALLLANLLAVALIDGATHGASQFDPYRQLLGSWKGIHNHKNHAGGVAAITCMMAFCFILSGRWPHILVLIPATLFLIGTNSKTSIALTVFVIGLLCVTKGLSALFGRFAARYLVILALVTLGAVIVGYWGEILAILNDPYALTGRVEVWNALVRYIEIYPWTGSGFGSFWRLGAESPILHLTDGWGTNTGNGHNGYLDAAVTIGLPGLILMVLVLVVAPSIAVIQRLTHASLLYDVSFCFILFGLGHNVLESSFLSGNNPVFFVLLLGMFGLRARSRQNADEAVWDRTKLPAPTRQAEKI